MMSDYLPLWVPFDVPVRTLSLAVLLPFCRARFHWLAEGGTRKLIVVYLLATQRGECGSPLV